MRYEWDDAKNALNRRKHGIGFEDMARFDWDFAVLLQQQVVAFERRELWAGIIGDGIFAVVVTERHGDITRIISLRRANNVERRIWQREFHDG